MKPKEALAALGAGLVAALGCASYSVADLDEAAHPELAAVMLRSRSANAVGRTVATLETERRGGRDCSDLGEAALRDLLERAKARGGVGVKDVEFRGRSRWVGQVVCRSSPFGRSVAARGIAYDLGEPVPIPGALSIAVPEGMRPQFTEVAILSVAAQQPMPEWVTTYLAPASLPLEALKEQWMQAGPRAGWQPASRESGRVVADYRQGEFAMRAVVTYTRQAVTVQLGGSRSLGQTATQISAAGAGLFREFAGDIQGALGALAARR